MGVRNLTSFAEENARLLCETLSFPCHASNTSATLSSPHSATFLTAEQAATSTPQDGRAFVVDAFAYLFTRLASSDYDVARGGDYAQYMANVKTEVTAWRAVGLHPIFVFDGPRLLAKLPKQVERRQQTAKEANLYMRSPAASRMSCPLAPPLLIYALLDALQHTTPPTHIILAETEADCVVADLAHRLKGHAVSQDSDYFVLCARGQGTSYVPLSSFAYVVESPTEVNDAGDSAAELAEETGFETVSRRRRRGRGPVSVFAATSGTTALSQAPPENLSMLRAVRFDSYSSTALARILDLPAALLPLFAALAGNDYLPELQAKILFEPFKGSERLKEAAAVLRRAWLASLAGKKPHSSRPTLQGTRSGPGRGSAASRHGADFVSESGSVTASSATATPLQSCFAQSQQLKQVDPVRTLVQECVELALKRANEIRPNRYVSSGEKEEMVDGIVEGAATYSLLTHAHSVSAVPNEAALFFSSEPPVGSRAEGVAAYVQAYRLGQLHEDLLTGLCQRTYLGKVFAEDPDQQSTQKFAAREIRRWAWAVLFDTWGMKWARETIEAPDVDRDTDQTEEDHVAKALRRPFGGAYKDGEAPDDVISVKTESSEEHSETEDVAMLDPDTLPNRPNSALADRPEDVNFDILGRLKPPPTLTEYARQGDGVKGDTLTIPALEDLLDAHGGVDKSTAPPTPLQALRTLLMQKDHAAVPCFRADARYELYLYALKALTPSIRALPADLRPLAACLRFMVLADADRYQEKTAKMAWSIEELGAALRSAVAALRHWRRPTEALVARETRNSGELAAIQSATRQNGSGGLRRDDGLHPTTRAVHASTALQLVLEASYLLSQALLLGQEAHPPPFALHDGPIFHAIILKRPSGEGERDKALEQAALSAVLEGGLEQHLAVNLDVERRARKEQRKKEQSIARSKQNAPPGKSFTNRPPSPKNAYAALLNETLG